MSVPRTPAGAAGRLPTDTPFYDALRFINWLNNGQGSGDTETGAYTLLGGTRYPSNGETNGVVIPNTRSVRWPEKGIAGAQ